MLEFDGRRRLARRRGASDDHEPHLVLTLPDHIRGTTDVLDVGAIRLPHDLGEFAPRDARVQAFHGMQIVVHAPIQGLPDLAPGDIARGIEGATDAFLPTPSPLLPIEDIGLGRLGVAVLDQHLLHHVLDLFHGRDVIGRRHLFQPLHHPVGQPLGQGPIAPPHSHSRAIDGVADALLVKGDHGPRSLDNLFYPAHRPSRKNSRIG